MDIACLDSIVLKRVKFGDTSIIATLFTREQGKISVIAKGARSPRSSRGLASALEPLNRIEATVYTKSTRSMQIISSADIIDDFHAVKSNLDRIGAANDILSRVERMTFQEDACSTMWDTLNRALQRLSMCSLENIPSAKLLFRAEILTAVGLAPIVASCTICNTSLEEKAFFSAQQGGAICPHCSDTGISLDNTDIEILVSLFAESSSAEICYIPEHKLKKIEAIIEHHERYHAC